MTEADGEEATVRPDRAGTVTSKAAPSGARWRLQGGCAGGRARARRFFW